MKNLTRILALVLVFTMMVSSAAFAAKFTDVAEDSQYAEAVEVLSALGILNGYEDGTFKPDAVITRAEVVAVVNRLQGLSDAAKAAAGTSMYTDVATTDWFAGDVNLASQMGIVAGDGNGLFRPNDQVKYEEAVKMVVAALGYKQDYVLKQGGWPTGYLIIATDKGVTKGLSVSAGEPAHRGIVAKLAYQSLSAPMMVLGSYDDEGKATYVSDATETLLGAKLGYAKLIGHVAANEVSTVDGGTPTTAGTIKFETANNETVKSASEKDAYGYKCYIGDVDVVDFNEIDTDGDAVKDALLTKEILVNDTDVAATLGLATEIYVGLNEDNKAEILTYIVDDSKNSTVEIANSTHVMTESARDYPSNFTSTTNGITGDLSVYDEDNDSTNTEYVLENASIILNGAYVDSKYYNDSLGGALGKVLFPASGALTLLDNDGNGKYDIIYVDTYETMVVNSVFDSGKKVSMKVGSTLDLTSYVEEKEGYSYSITLDGEEIAVTDLQEYDVLTVSKTMKISGTAGSAEVKDGKSVNIVVTRNKVEGYVESVDPHTVARKVVYTVAGADYTIANIANTSKYPVMKTGNEGTFYLDSVGQVAFFEGTSALSGNLAFIRRAGSYTSNWDSTKTEYEIELINKDGSIGVYTIAENVTVKLNDKDAYIDSTSEVKDLATFKGTVGDKSYDNTDEDKTNDKDPYKQSKDAVGGALTALATATASEEAYAKRVITYKANSANEIVAVTFAEKGTGEGLVYETVTTPVEYDAEVSALDYGITENTVVFYAPYQHNEDNGETKTYTYEDIEVASNAFFKDGTKYELAYIDVDDANNANVVVVTYSNTSILDGNNTAVILAVRDTKNAESEDVKEIDIYQSGEKVTLQVEYDNMNDSFVSKLERGAYLDYAVNAQGYIDEATVVTVADVKGGSYALKRPDDKPASCYVGGYVVDASSSAVVLNTTFKGAIAGTVDGYKAVTNGQRLAIPANANVYYIDTTKTRIIPELAGIGDIVACQSYQEFVDTDGDTVEDTMVVKAEKGANTFVVMKYIENTIVDVIIYYGFDL